MVGAPLSFMTLWDSATHLAPYDAVLLSCEGAPTTNPNVLALYEYTVAGGRVFASHFHYQWLLGAPWPGLATWYTGLLNQLVDPTLGIIATTLPNGAPFPEAQTMKTWLGSANALTDAGELPIAHTYHNADVALGNVGTPWMHFDTADASFTGTVNDPLGPQSTLLLSYDTMTGQGEASCGRVVYSDLHVGGNSGDYGESPNASSPPAGQTDVPTGCNANVDLSPQEKAIEFTLFDLTSCPAPPGSAPGVTIAAQ